MSIKYCFSKKYNNSERYVLEPRLADTCNFVKQIQNKFPGKLY